MADKQTAGGEAPVAPCVEAFGTRRGSEEYHETDTADFGSEIKNASALGIKRPASDEEMEPPARKMKMAMPRGEALVLPGADPIVEKMRADARSSLVDRSVEGFKKYLDTNTEQAALVKWGEQESFSSYLAANPEQAALVKWNQESYQSYIARNPEIERDLIDNWGLTWSDIDLTPGKLRHGKLHHD
ncbi:MAG: hypothetical protein Q9226_007826 [Calogaya cf. arnoldii]